MPLNALFTRRTLGLTVVGLGASYLLLKTVNPRPQGQQKPTGDYRVETHRSGYTNLVAAGVIGDEDKKTKGEAGRVLNNLGQSKL